LQIPGSAASGMRPRPGLASRVVAQAGGVATSVPTLAFATVVIFAVFDYGRPQDVIPGLGAIRPSLLLTLLIGGALVNYSQALHFEDPKLRWFAVLIVFMAAWVPLASNNYWAFQIFLTMAQLFAFSLAFVAFVDTAERLRIFVLVWIVCTTYQAYWGVTHAGRGTGAFLGDENDFCLAMNMMVPFALLTLRHARTVAWKILCLVATGLYLAAVVSSQSRGGFVGLGVTLFALIAFSKHRVRILLASGVAALAVFALAPPTYFTEMSTISDTHDSTRLARLKMWKNARAAFADNPIFGVGQGNVNWRVGEYEHYDPEKERSFAGHAVHSVYFTLLPELGLCGVAIYLSFVLLILKDSMGVVRRARAFPGSGLDSYARATVCGLAAYLVCGLFVSTLYYPHLYYLMAISTTVRLLQSKEIAAATAAATPSEAPA